MTCAGGRPSSLGACGFPSGCPTAVAVARYVPFPAPATSNRACRSPAHGSPTSFTAGIRLVPAPWLERPRRDNGSIQFDQPKLITRLVVEHRPAELSASLVAFGYQQRDAHLRVGSDLFEVPSRVAVLEEPGPTVGSPRGISPRGSHGTERDRLRSFRSSHPLHRYARIHTQCAKSSGSLPMSPRHQALNRFHVRSRLYFLRAHRIK